MARSKTGMKKLALKLCKMEGGKKQVNIAQAEDLLHKLCLLLAADPATTVLALVAGAGLKKKKEKRK